MTEVFTIIYGLGFVVAAICTWIGNRYYGDDASGLFIGFMWPVYALGFAAHYIARIFAKRGHQ